MTPSNQQFFIKACEIANFVQRYYPPACIWEDPVGWAQFHLMHGFCFTVRVDDNGPIVAVGVARPVENPGDGAVAYRFKEGSDCLYVDLLVVPGTMTSPLSTFAEIWELRFGKPKRICYFRRPESGITVKNYDRLKETARKKEGHQAMKEIYLTQGKEG